MQILQTRLKKFKAIKTRKFVKRLKMKNFKILIDKNNKISTSKKLYLPLGKIKKIQNKLYINKFQCTLLSFITNS